MNTKFLSFAFGIAFSINAFSQTLSDSTVIIKTKMGDITVGLYNETPGHKSNFLKLVKDGYLNGSSFHRVINSFMIQGGGKEGGTTDVGYTIPGEFNPKLYHKKGALSAARTNNPEKRSSGSQFYIVQGKKASAEELAAMEQRLKITYSEEQKKTYMEQGGTPFLDMNYSVFGEVISGLDVVDKIAAVKTGAMDKPVEDVFMSVELVVKNSTTNTAKAPVIKATKKNKNKKKKK